MDGANSEAKEADEFGGEYDGAPERSLFDDVEAAIDDGKTYLSAEIQYQKTRAAFVADRAKDAAIFAALGGALAVLALVALTVGLVLALTPHLTAWGASAAVTLLWLFFAFIFIRMAARRWHKLLGAFVERGEEE